MVWRGITTSHIRKTVEQNMTQEDLREAWLTLSPSAYVSKLRNNRRPMLMLSALYDLSFPPDLSDNSGRRDVGTSLVIELSEPPAPGAPGRETR